MFQIRLSQLQNHAHALRTQWKLWMDLSQCRKQIKFREFHCRQLCKGYSWANNKFYASPAPHDWHYCFKAWIHTANQNTTWQCGAQYLKHFETKSFWYIMVPLPAPRRQGRESRRSTYCQTRCSLPGPSNKKQSKQSIKNQWELRNMFFTSTY